MRKLVLLSAGLCLALGWAAAAYAQQDEARDIITKAIKAQGGEAALLKQNTSTMRGKGTIELPGLGKAPFSFESHTQMPDKLKVAIDLDAGGMNLTVMQVLNGDKGWISLMGMVTPMDEDTLKESRGLMYVERVMGLVDLKDQAFKLSTLGEKQVQGHDAVGVQVKKDGERDVSLWFDKKDNLLLKAEYRALDDSKAQITQEKLVSNYKEFDGVKAPSRQVVNNDGKPYVEMDITDMKCVAKHDAGVFGEPK